MDPARKWIFMRTSSSQGGMGGVKSNFGGFFLVLPCPHPTLHLPRGVFPPLELPLSPFVAQGRGQGASQQGETLNQGWGTPEHPHTPKPSIPSSTPGTRGEAWLGTALEYFQSRSSSSSTPTSLFLFSWLPKLTS